jgi:hypothetical protein
VLNKVLDEEGEFAELLEGRIVNIFYLFSQAENHVKEMIADRMILKRVLKDLKRMSPNHQITMLKFIKNLSMLSTTLEGLQNSNAIEVLTDLLSSSMKEQVPHFREMSNQVLNTMYNLCRLSKDRQEDAALNGLIPLLQRIVKTERPLKEFALPILCDMAHSGKVGRKVLWQNRGLAFYISLLSDPYWQVTALDAIFIWLQEETAKVEENLLYNETFTEAIVRAFNTSKANAFENILEPLQNLLRLSPAVAQTLARPDLFARVLQKLSHNKAVIRLNLLRIIRSICDASDGQGGLIRQHGLFHAIQRLAETDSAVLVRNMASELLKSSLETDQKNGANRRQALRRTSSTYTPPTGSLSVPGSPVHNRTAPTTMIFDPPPKFEQLVRTRPSTLRNGGGLPSMSPLSGRPPSRESPIGRVGIGSTPRQASRPASRPASRGNGSSMPPSSSLNQSMTGLSISENARLESQFEGGPIEARGSISNVSRSRLPRHSIMAPMSNATRQSKIPTPPESQGQESPVSASVSSTSASVSRATGGGRNWGAGGPGAARKQRRMTSDMLRNRPRGGDS